MPRRFAIALLSIALAGGPLSSAANAQPLCTGVVYDDRDGNHRFGPQDEPLPGVKLSDGVQLVRTDAQGRYRIRPRDGRMVFLIKPAGYSIEASAGVAPIWMPDAASGACRDFELMSPDDNLHWHAGPARVLVIADPQPKSPIDVDYFRRDVVATIGDVYARGFREIPGRGRVMEGAPADLGLVLGDISNDDPSLYPGIKDALSGGIPWLYVPGNHDIDVGARDDASSLRSYHEHFGPDTHAWEGHAATFVLLDDVLLEGAIHQPGQSPSYIGGLRADQFEFLETYLPTVPRDRLLVVAVHIPLFEQAGRDSFRDADRERLFALLDDFPHVLLLSGHSHTQRHFFHDAATGWHGRTPLHEYNVGAASGAFWSGITGDDGIPDTTMADGTPNGHAMLQPRGDGRYELSWHPAGLPESHEDADYTQAMALHAPNVLRRGSWPSAGVYANVFMGMEDTRVEYRIDGGAWRPMRKVLEPDPRVLRQNVLDDAATELRSYDRAPQATPSPHLWRGVLPTDLAIGEHRIEVRAFDRWQGEQRAATRYLLVNAKPL